MQTRIPVIKQPVMHQQEMVLNKGHFFFLCLGVTCGFSYIDRHVVSIKIPSS
jgi:hypothetical protein